MKPLSLSHCLVVFTCVTLATSRIISLVFLTPTYPQWSKFSFKGMKPLSFSNARTLDWDQTNSAAPSTTLTSALKFRDDNVLVHCSARDLEQSRIEIKKDKDAKESRAAAEVAAAEANVATCREAAAKEVKVGGEGSFFTRLNYLPQDHIHFLPTLNYVHVFAPSIITTTTITTFTPCVPIAFTLLVLLFPPSLSLPPLPLHPTHQTRLRRRIDPIHDLISTSSRFLPIPNTQTVQHTSRTCVTLSSPTLGNSPATRAPQSLLWPRRVWRSQQPVTQPRRRRRPPQRRRK
jgi:hypothetical protein